MLERKRIKIKETFRKEGKRCFVGVTVLLNFEYHLQRQFEADDDLGKGAYF